MKTLSLFFEVHRPMLLRTYRFFDMGVDHNYLDDARNRTAMQRAAMNVYQPMNALLADLIRAHGNRFHVSFYLSGLAIEQMRSFAPDALQSFRDLAATGCVEFVAGTYSDSLASLAGEEPFRDEVARHTEIIRREFGQTPRTLYNTAMLYSDSIGAMAASMGYQTMLGEGARHLLGWKSPNYVYANPLNQKLRVLLRNYRLSDDIAFRFSDTRWSEWPLTAEKYLGWIQGDRGDTVNLCLDYDVFGSWQRADSGIFDFVRAFVDQAIGSGFTFVTPAESARAHQPIGILHAPHATSWADEERDTSAWLGNELQQEAFNKLYAQYEAVRQLDSPDLNHVWNFLQTADHFYWMGTKWFTEASRQNSNNPYGSSYDAFINYMNVLSDFINEIARRKAAATSR
ncbi:MAG TPA: glycoside hydrolase family 57 protein [Candidatus Tidjanibacter faecipullorum]|uniref:Glycoside hydrolase family 57 protein n=1 Tax=Candidatus Tidjanibacter faecipullorum TaxID=2838766 RepID=A0A9D2DCP8_9BACT|nr:glycoside hydrolase family 57 protein [Candidatus Tidjanibacter faecipullorum]